MYNRSHIGFSVPLLLGRVGVGLLLAVCLVSCKTTQLPPIDDAYYWPEKNTPSHQQSSIINQQSSIINQQSTIKNQKSPIIEYLNVQDTTVTVRIKR